jgi:hypothetical protein
MQKVDARSTREANDRTETPDDPEDYSIDLTAARCRTGDQSPPPPAAAR